MPDVTGPTSFRSPERLAEAVDILATHVAAFEYPSLPAAARERLRLMLTDLFGVTLAGMRTPELRALVGAWHLPPGDEPITGTPLRSTAETSTYISAIAACVLELDEGNKYAAGHPAAHVLFAAVAAALQSSTGVSGSQFLTAVAAGYEVAARFGRATDRHPEWHTHGHWGATGAATASALLLGAGPAQVATAIDASTGLMLVTPWATVLSGDFTRNLWLAGANMAGVHAARLALAGLVENTGSAQHSLGAIVGTLDHGLLVKDLDGRLLLAEGYLKRHTSCSYTHAAVDIVQALRAAGTWSTRDIAAVQVTTSSLASTLLGRHPRNRLAAMFSLPFVVSNAVVNGSVDPTTMQPGSEPFRAAEEFSGRVHVDVSPRLDAYLPDRRCTEVAIEFTDGTSVGLGQPNPIGDSSHFPLTQSDVHRKLSSLVGAPATGRIESLVAALPDAPSAAAVLTELAGVQMA